VSLDALHEHIARIVFALPEARQVALAGGGAMLAHDLVDRPTQDVDLFTPDPSEVMQLADVLALALRGEGAQVNVDRREPGFTRLAVTVSDGRSVVVEVAHDARIREAVQLSFGRVLHPEEVAAEKDPGFARSVFADALAAAAAHPDTAFAELGLEPKAVAALRAGAARWRALLLDAAGRAAPDTVRSFGAPRSPGPKAPGSGSRSRPSERHRPPPFNAGRNGPSPSL